MRVVLSVLFCLVFSSCLGPREERPVYSRDIAQVGDYQVKEDWLRFRFRLELEKLPKDYVIKYQKMPLDETNNLKPIFDGVLKKIVEDYSILTYGKKHGMEISSEELQLRFEKNKARLSQKELESLLGAGEIPYHRWKQLAEEQISVQYVMEKALGDKVVPGLGELRDYYNRNRDEFRTPEEIRIRHIVTDSEEKAQDILKRLKAGENFAKLAINHSISPDRAGGGELGYFSRGQFPPVFDAAFSLQKGEVSGIIKSEYGFHIFKLLDKKPAGTKPFEDVVEAIQQKIFEQKLKTHYKSWMERVLKDVPVVMNEKNLKDFVL